MASFWQTYTPAIVNPNGLWITYSPIKGTDKLRAQITIPPFSIDVPFWLGASYITMEFRANFTEGFSILRPVKRPVNADFILSIRSVHDYQDANNYKLDRYHFWNITDEPGELPSWSIYNGETICKSFALEIWTVQGKQFTSSTTPIVLDTSILTTVEDCCDSGNMQIPVTPVCNLFANLPLNLTGAPLPTSILTTEDGTPILTEDGQFIFL